MAVGDTVSEIASVAGSGTMTIQPGSGVEWIIHNLCWSGGATVGWYDGTNACTFQTDTAAGGLINTCFHLTNAHYLRITNTSESVAIVCEYDGVISK